MVAVGVDVAGPGALSGEPPAASSKPADPASDLIAWRHDLAAALDEGERSGLPVLVYLRADWAAPSIKAEREVWPDPLVRDAMVAAVPVWLDVTREDDEKASADAARARATRVPSVVLLVEDERPRELESIDKAAVLALLRELRKGQGTRKP